MDYVPGHNLLDGKRVLVTAAAGTGIGFATATALAARGATVIAHGRNRTKGEHVVKEMIRTVKHFLR